MARRYSPQIEQLIESVAAERGIPASRLRAFVGIESGGNPGVKTGSYKGLLQLSNSEFAKAGGQGSIFDPEANLRAGAVKLQAEAEQFKRKFGREPSDADLYLVHQQGWGGAQKHWENPERPAWQSMYLTGEGQQKGEGWAKQAIWGNVPDDVKKKFGSVDNITSGDFTNLWSSKVERFGGDATAAPVQDPRNVAMNGGQFGVDPDGFAGVASPLQTAVPVNAGVVSPQTPPPATAIAAKDPSFGDIAQGMLSSLLSGDKFKSVMSGSEDAPPIPKSPLPGDSPMLRRNVNVGQLLAIVKNRSNLGTA